MTHEHHACHCGMGRRWSGGSGFLGTTATLFDFLKPTQAYTMSVGTFDDQAPFELVREIVIDKKPAGYAFAGDHERWTEAETCERLTP